MPRLTLTAAQKAQLQTWLAESGWTPTQQAQVDLLNRLIANDGKNVTLASVPAAEMAAAVEVRDSLTASEERGSTLPPAQVSARGVWDWVASL